MLANASIVKQACHILHQQADSLARCADRLAHRSDGYERAVALLYETLQGYSPDLSPSTTPLAVRPAKIVVTGVGKSGHVARKVCATLQSTGSLAVFLHPTEALHGDLGVIAPGDALLLFSHSGRTEELVRLVNILHQQQRSCRVVAVCGDANSPLGQLSDAWIDARVDAESDPTLPAPTASTTLALALGDCLALTLARMRSITCRDFAANHPGGNLGRVLNPVAPPSLPTANVGDSIAARTPPLSADNWMPQNKPVVPLNYLEGFAKEIGQS
ncbi:hypothetical protein BDF22DRAFT_682719 [Syncephalis plumigaleata]|nr:hypothetical protein BDF22DRAFT_682719 [Syncephalis plumigaleata]